MGDDSLYSKVGLLFNKVEFRIPVDSGETNDGPFTFLTHVVLKFHTTVFSAGRSSRPDLRRKHPLRVPPPRTRDPDNLRWGVRSLVYVSGHLRGPIEEDGVRKKLIQRVKEDTKDSSLTIHRSDLLFNCFHFFTPLLLPFQIIPVKEEWNLQQHRKTPTPHLATDSGRRTIF